MSRYYWHLPHPLAYHVQVRKSWPDVGNHVMAAYNTKSVVLYVTCPRSIAITAVTYQGFRKNFIFEKVVWSLTPTFLTIAHDSKWAAEPDGASGQSILAISVTRWGFEEILKIAATTKNAIRPLVKFEWVPAVEPSTGAQMDRNCLLLHFKREIVEKFIDEMITSVDDVTPFVRRQRNLLWSSNPDASGQLTVPLERPYHLIYHNDSRHGLDLDRPYDEQYEAKTYRSFTVIST